MSDTPTSTTQPIARPMQRVTSLAWKSGSLNRRETALCWFCMRRFLARCSCGERRGERRERDGPGPAAEAGTRGPGRHRTCTGAEAGRTGAGKARKRFVLLFSSLPTSLLLMLPFRFLVQNQNTLPSEAKVLHLRSM